MNAETKSPHLPRKPSMFDLFTLSQHRSGAEPPPARWLPSKPRRTASLPSRHHSRLANALLGLTPPTNPITLLASLLPDHISPSPTSPLSQGVPQGSVLGPLFVLHMLVNALPAMGPPVPTCWASKPPWVLSFLPELGW